MRPAAPPHYMSFRLLLVLVVLGALAGAAWWIVQPQVWSEVMRLVEVYS